MPSTNYDDGGGEDDIQQSGRLLAGSSGDGNEGDHYNGDDDRGGSGSGDGSCVGDGFRSVEDGIARAAGFLFGVSATHPAVVGSGSPLGVSRQAWMGAAMGVNAASTLCLLLAIATGLWSGQPNDVHAFAWFGTSVGPGNLWLVMEPFTAHCLSPLHHFSSFLNSSSIIFNLPWVLSCLCSESG